MTIGENIRYLRKQAHLTQKQLADLCGVHEMTIRGYETGKYKPKANNLSKLCKALHCAASDILEKPAPEHSTEENSFDLSRYEKIMNRISIGKSLEANDLYFLSNECIQEYYQSLNPEGKKEADQMIINLLKNLQLLSKIPEYQNEKSSGNSSGNDKKNGTK